MAMGSFDRGGRGGGRSFGGGSRGGFGGGSRGGNGFGRDDRGPRGDRPMFTATCSNCGKECQVPFRPTNGKPVYCSDCFEKMGPKREERGERGNFHAPVVESNKAQLDMIVTKLDKIIRLLEPKVAPKEDVAISTPVEADSEISSEPKKKVKKLSPKKK